MIDNGGELFGNATMLQNGQRAANGFVALAEFDDNHDGTIDANDAIWTRLVLWRDSNHDGVSQPWEVTPAADRLDAISLAYHWTPRQDLAGNLLRYQSLVRISNARGHSVGRPVYDVFFVRIQ